MDDGTGGCRNWEDSSGHRAVHFFKVFGQDDLLPSFAFHPYILVWKERFLKGKQLKVMLGNCLLLYINPRVDTDRNWASSKIGVW